MRFSVIYSNLTLHWIVALQPFRWRSNLKFFAPFFPSGAWKREDLNLFGRVFLSKSCAIHTFRRPDFSQIHIIFKYLIRYNIVKSWWTLEMDSTKIHSRIPLSFITTTTLYHHYTENESQWLKNEEYLHGPPYVPSWKRRAPKLSHGTLLKPFSSTLKSEARNWPEWP